MIDLDFFQSFGKKIKNNRMVFLCKRKKRKMIKKREEEDFLFVRKFGKFLIKKFLILL